MTEEFKYEVDADGVAIITWDLPGKSMNVLTEAGVRQLDAAIDRAIADDAVKGVVITSGKEDFAGGMDINVLAKAKKTAAEAGGNPAQGIFDMTMGLHKGLRKIELMGKDPKTKRGGKPVAVATPGTALGIGMELMLAGHRRFAADNPKAKLGLPEVMIGIFPGAGGTTRVFRMMGLLPAAPILMEGKMFSPDRAKSAGLVDEVVPADQLVARAKEWVLNAKEADYTKPWDQKGYKIPGGGPYHPMGMQNFIGATAMTHGKSQGAFQHIKAMLSAIYEGALVDFDTALRIEARWFTKVLMHPSSEAMMRSLFVNKQAIEKGARRPAHAPDAKVKKLGVLGAGMMGAGIAQVSLEAGIEVVLIDRDQEGVDRGKGIIEAALDGKIKKRRMDEAKKADIMGRLTATPDYGRLQGCDLIVEAVFEDPGLKAKVTEMAEAQIASDAIFASNTSTIRIDRLAEASVRKQNFIGIHFFSPVDKMMLVEIIKGQHTGDSAVAKALDFVGQLKKTPIVVNDEFFFYANRCIIPYINEGVMMVAEGVKPWLVEAAAKQLGMPVGPLQVQDEVSLELGIKISDSLREALGDAYPQSPAEAVIRTMVNDKQRLGRKNNAGFYEYDEKGKRAGIWPGLAEMYPHAAQQPELEEVKSRLILSQTLEAVRALEAGVLVDIREGDVGAILGWGFVPWSGGPFGWCDIQGAAKVVNLCEELTAKFGPRFEAPALLREMAQKGETFYGRFGAEQVAA